MRNWEQEFAKLKDGPELYPGSNHPIVRSGVREVRDPTGEWDENPRRLKVNGVDVEFFTVGQLGQALGGRQSVTIRKWEREGVIPRAMFQAPSETPNGRRRLYTRDQVEGMIRIAREEGVYYSHQTPIKKTRFTERVVQLFKELGVPGK